MSSLMYKDSFLLSVVLVLNTLLLYVRNKIFYKTSCEFFTVILSMFHCYRV